MKNQDNFKFHRKGKSTPANAEMTQMLEGPDEDLSCFYTNIPASNCEHSGNKWKNRKPQQKSRSYKKEPNRKYKLK